MEGTENYSQYLIINHNGKEYEKEYIYTYMYMCTKTIYTHTCVCAQRTTYSMCVSVFHFQVFTHFLLLEIFGRIQNVI